MTIASPLALGGGDPKPFQLPILLEGPARNRRDRKRSYNTIFLGRGRAINEGKESDRKVKRGPAHFIHFPFEKKKMKGKKWSANPGTTREEEKVLDPEAGNDGVQGTRSRDESKPSPGGRRRVPTHKNRTDSF